MRCSRLAALLAVVFASGACDSGTAPEPPAAVLLVSGDLQVGSAGAVLPEPLAVRVTHADGSPASGVKVAFTMTGGGGLLSPANTRTDANGDAEALWKLGAQPGAQGATVTVEGLTPVTFSATALGPPTAILRVSGNAQSGIQGTLLSNQIVVRVVDALGAAVPGARVTFAVVDGGGSVSPTVSLTDAHGDAATLWQLGSTLGTQRVSATVSGLAAVTFVANATGAPARVGITSGDGQSAIHGTRLANPLLVRVVDAQSTPVRGVTVQFEVVTGGGTLTANTAVTDANGNADASWTLGNATGAQTVRASVAGVDPVTFTATSTGDPSRLALHPFYARDSVTAGSTILAVFSVFDSDGRLVPGVAVSFSVTAGGGTVAPPSVTSNQFGEAVAQWTIGASGPQSLLARSGSLSATMSLKATPP